MKKRIANKIMQQAHRLHYKQHTVDNAYAKALPTVRKDYCWSYLTLGTTIHKLLEQSNATISR